MTKLPAITFPKTSGTEWTNTETGVQIARHGRGDYRVTTPVSDGVRGIRYVGGEGFRAVFGTLAEARAEARRFIEEFVRPSVAAVYVEALAEHIDRAEAQDGVSGHPAAERCIRFARSAMDSGEFAKTIDHVMGSARWAESTRRRGLCTAKVNSAYPHAFELKGEVTIDLSIRPGEDTCGKTEAEHAEFTPERIRSANWHQEIYRRAASNALPPKNIPMNMTAAYRELVDEAHAEALAENAALLADLDKARAELRASSDIPLCLRTDSCHFFHMKAIQSECRETADDEPIGYVLTVQGRAVTMEMKATPEGVTREMQAEQMAAYVDASEIIAEATADPDTVPSKLPPVPAELDDAAGWEAYIRSTTSAPTPDEMVTTLLDFSHPYREEIESCRVMFRDAARSIWRARHAGIATADSYRRMREVMATSRTCIQTYNGLARAWAHRELAN